MLDWFDIRGLSSSQTQYLFLSHLEYAIYKWLQTQAFDKLVFSGGDTGDTCPDQDFWKERKAAETALRSYLADFPCMRVRKRV